MSEVQDESKGRHLIDLMLLQFPEDKTLDYLEMEHNRVEFNPPVPLKANTLYRLQLWHDGSISLWELIADGVKGLEQ